MSDYVIELGGAKRELRYTKDERKELERKYSCGLLELINKRILPTEVGENKAVQWTGGGEWEPQVTLIYFGLRHYGKKVTYQVVEEWIDEHVQKGGHIVEFLAVVIAAVWASGVLGKVVDVKADEGKDPAEAS